VAELRKEFLLLAFFLQVPVKKSQIQYTEFSYSVPVTPILDPFFQPFFYPDARHYLIWGWASFVLEAA
jgi:hypothetical protein